MIDRDEFFLAYTEAAIWSSTYTRDEDGNPADEEGPDTWVSPMDETFNTDDIYPDTLATMRDDCNDFIDSNATTLAQYIEQGQSSGQAGHDFWLTRNGHGAGFWDRGLGKLGDDLTKASRTHGSFDLYVGDDGRVYGQ